MPTSVTCPHCEKKYQVTDDKLGRKAKCKSCGNAFTLQVAELDGFDEMMMEMEPARPAAPLPKATKVMSQSNGQALKAALAMFAFGTGMAIFNYLTLTKEGTVYPAMVFLGPLLSGFGLAGLINPSFISAPADGTRFWQYPPRAKIGAIAGGAVAIALWLVLMFVWNSANVR